MVETNRWLWATILVACVGCGGAGAAGGPSAVDEERPDRGRQKVADSARGVEASGSRDAHTAVVAVAGEPEPPLAPSIAAEPDDTLVDVPAGVIRSGCPRERRAVCLGRKVQAFRIQRRFTTVAAYEACVRSGACAPAPYKASGAEAVHDVEWAQAQRSCLSRGMRLPTEAEWERAREEGAIDVGPKEPTEWLLGWYTFFHEGFRGEDVGIKGIGNTRLVIRIESGQSYRYGVQFLKLGSGNPPIAFRCVAGPPPDVPRVRCVLKGGSVDCKDE